MSRHVRLAALLTLCASLTASTGCMTMSGARPLYPGQHQAGVTVGGPMVELGSPLPLPNAVIEGRSGLTYLNKRPLDLNYGLNATAIALGNTNRSVGATNLNEQSSRSHMIVTLTVFSTSKVNGAQVTRRHRHRHHRHLRHHLLHHHTLRCCLRCCHPEEAARVRRL